MTPHTNQALSLWLATEGGNTDTHLQILAAIQSLSWRMEQFEANRSSSSSPPPGKEDVPTDGQQSCPGEGVKDDDVLSHLAPHTLFDESQQSGEGSQCDGSHSDSAEVDDESTMKEEFPLNTLITKVISAAKIFGLQSPLSYPVPAGGVWEGIS